MTILTSAQSAFIAKLADGDPTTVKAARDLIEALFQFQNDLRTPYSYYSDDVAKLITAVNQKAV